MSSWLWRFLAIAYFIVLMVWFQPFAASAKVGLVFMAMILNAIGLGFFAGRESKE